jgi:hypothetical protein
MVDRLLDGQMGRYLTGEKKTKRRRRRAKRGEFHPSMLQDGP